MSELDKLRTVLANERTLLAYIRTTLSAWIFGMAAVKFFPEHPTVIGLGWVAIAAGTMILVWGTVRARICHKKIHQ
jgi:putative membrane protein